MRRNILVVTTVLLSIAAMLLCGFSAVAADKALILNDARQQALYQALDAAVRQQGIASAPALLDLLNVLRTAPTVEETKPIDEKKGDQPK